MDVNKTVRRQVFCMQEPQSFNAKLGTTFAVALKRHWQYHSKIICENCRVIYKCESKPSSITKGGIANYGVFPSRGWFPVQEIMVYVFASKRKYVHANSPPLRQAIKERSCTCRRLYKVVLLVICTIKAHKIE